MAYRTIRIFDVHAKDVLVGTLSHICDPNFDGLASIVQVLYSRLLWLYLPASGPAVRTQRRSRYVLRHHSPVRLHSGHPGVPGNLWYQRLYRSSLHSGGNALRKLAPERKNAAGLGSPQLKTGIKKSEAPRLPIFLCSETPFPAHPLGLTNMTKNILQGLFGLGIPFLTAAEDDAVFTGAFCVVAAHT